MANYCITKYWIEGDVNTLRKMASLIGEGRNVTEILPGMGMPFSDLSFREEGCPYWYGADMKNGVLCFTEEAKWEQSQCLWKLKDMEDSGIGDICYYSFVSESDFYQTNDAEGKHFPYRITVFCDRIPASETPYFYVGRPVRKRSSVAWLKRTDTSYSQRRLSSSPVRPIWESTR